MWEYFGTARWENPVINFLIGDWSGLKREEVIRAIGETKFYNHCRQNVHFFHRGKLSCILQFQAYSWPMQLSWGPRKGDGFSPISHSSPIIASLIAGEKNIQRYKWRKFKCIQNNGGGGGWGWGVLFEKRKAKQRDPKKYSLSSHRVSASLSFPLLGSGTFVQICKLQEMHLEKNASLCFCRFFVTPTGRVVVRAQMEIKEGEEVLQSLNRNAQSSKWS